jgi:hypothetical protein
VQAMNHSCHFSNVLSRSESDGSSRNIEQVHAHFVSLIGRVGPRRDREPHAQPAIFRPWFRQGCGFRRSQIRCCQNEKGENLHSCFHRSIVSEAGEVETAISTTRPGHGEQGRGIANRDVTEVLAARFGGVVIPNQSGKLAEDSPPSE